MTIEAIPAIMFSMNIYDRPISLADMLQANDLNRNTYNTLVRREGLDFLKRDILAPSGHRKFRLAHSVALGVVLWSRRSRIFIENPSELVTPHWAFIRENVARAVENDNHMAWIAYFYADGEPWKACAQVNHHPKDRQDNGPPPEGYEWDDIVGMLSAPIHKIARAQVTRLSSALSD